MLPLKCSSLSYEQVEIKENSIVYCDIPYKGTACYNLKNNTKEENNKNSFNHKRFFDWAATRNFPVFISEYCVDDSRFKLIFEIEKTVKMDAENKANNRKERLYWNGVKR